MKTTAPQPKQATEPETHRAAPQTDQRPAAVAQRQQQAAIAASPGRQTQALPARLAAPNRTGLPDQLKAGVENLSGYSLDDVQVHYNSAKPAQLQALAYAQGTNIHVAPGQEKHLPHEAWHVVQQKQGRVNATQQLKGGVNINDNVSLEKEADTMGTKSLQAIAVAQRKEAGTIHRDKLNSTVKQFKGGGSHGKHLHFKVTTVTVRNTVTNVSRYVNVNHDEDLGKVPSHGQGPANKTQADADAIARAEVNLGANEVIAEVLFNHYTR